MEFHFFSIEEKECVYMFSVNCRSFCSVLDFPILICDAGQEWHTAQCHRCTTMIPGLNAVWQVGKTKHRSTETPNQGNVYMLCQIFWVTVLQKLICVFRSIRCNYSSVLLLFGETNSADRRLVTLTAQYHWKGTSVFHHLDHHPTSYLFIKYRILLVNIMITNMSWFQIGTLSSASVIIIGVWQTS